MTDTKIKVDINTLITLVHISKISAKLSSVKKEEKTDNTLNTIDITKNLIIGDKTTKIIIIAPM